MTIDEALRRECASQTRKLEEGLVAIEQSPDEERVADLFRVAHSLKGNCGMAGLDGAKRLAHAVEDLLSDVRSDRVVPEGAVVDVALAAVDDITAMLDGAKPPVSPDDRVDRLRTALDDARERSAADEPESVDLSALTLPPADPDEDISVEEALQRASQFDDLDSLAEAIDDAPEFADLEGGGSFDDLGLDRDDASADAEPATGGGQSDMFDQIKAEVEQEDTDSLQRALEDVRFGEFDDEDDVTIQELIDLDLANEDVERDERAASLDADAPDAPGEDAFAGMPDEDAFADASEETRDADETAADAPEEPAPDAPADAAAGSGDDPATVASGGEVPDTGPERARDTPAFDSASSAFEAMKSEVETGDVDQLESDLEKVRFGEFDDEDDVSIQDLIDGTVDAEEPAEETASPGTGEQPTADAEPTVETEPSADATSETAATGTIDGFPDFDGTEATAEPEQATGAAGADAVRPDADAESVADADAESVADADAESPADAEAGPAADAGTESETDAETSAVEPADADVDDTEGGAAAMEWSSPEDPPETDEPLSEAGDIRSRELPDAFAAADEPAVTDEDATAAGEGTGTGPETEAGGAAAGSPDTDDVAESTAAEADATAAADEATEIDVPDLELPDLDVVTPPALDATETDAAAVEANPGFERDASTVEFESRFADLLGGDATVPDGKEEYPRTALTIGDSSLDGAQFRPLTDVATTTRRTHGTDDFQSITVDVETADSLLNLVEELSMLRLDMEEAVGRDPDPAVEESLTDLQGFLARFRRTVMDVRLMPLRSAVEGLPRVVRDVAQESDAEVALETIGTDVKLDRSIIDRLRDPLVHLVRNAVDHGIEPPDVREAAGKPREGRVTVEAERVRDRVEIVVSDDGRGIDPGEVREAAIDQGMLSPEAAHDMDRQGLFDLLFRAGFTTTTEVTSVSGRGVGMDVVHRVVTDLDGEVSVESKPGEGTRVTLSLPVTVAVTEVLFVESGTEQYGIPVSTVEQVSDPGPVVTEDGTELIERDPFVSPAAAESAGAAPAETQSGDDDAVERYPLVRLARAFDVSGETREDGKVVWVRPGEDRLALHCDRVREAREVVVKPYEEFLAHVPGISGATMLGNGSVVNIIDVQSI